MHVRAEAEVRPTEDLEKVKYALTRVITGAVQTIPDGKDRYVLRIESDDRSSLDRLKMILQRDRVRAAVHSVMVKNVRDNGELEVYLNKQVAYAGHVSFSQREGESPLGPIRLMIASSDIGSIIEWLTSGRVDSARIPGSKGRARASGPREQ